MADIVLKDRNGSNVTYAGIETVTFDTTTEGVQATYTEGVAVENLEIVPDFSGGDMAVSAAEGTLVKSAVIRKPVTEEVTVGEDIPMDFSGGDLEIKPSAADRFLSKVTVAKPENLIPEYVAKDVTIAGITGTLAAGGLDDWNVFVKVWTAQDGTSSWENHPIATAQEVAARGITLYEDGVVTNGHLKTILFMTKIRTEAITSETVQTTNFYYRQNWQMAVQNIASDCTRVSATYQYQNTTTNPFYASSYGSVNWAVGSGTLGLTSESGLFSNYKDGANRPIGTYLVFVIQHKTATVSDTLA